MQGGEGTSHGQWQRLRSKNQRKAHFTEPQLLRILKAQTCISNFLDSSCFAGFLSNILAYSNLGCIQGFVFCLSLFLIRKRTYHQNQSLGIYHSVVGLKVLFMVVEIQVCKSEYQYILSSFLASPIFELLEIAMS